MNAKVSGLSFQDEFTETEKLTKDLDEAKRLLSMCADEELPGWLHSSIARFLTHNAGIER